MSEVEHACIRAYVSDWTASGDPAHVCRDLDGCDEYEREILGCGLLPQFRGRGTAISHCPGWLRTQPLWEEIRDLFDSGVLPGREWPYKMLRAVRLIATYRTERARKANDGDEKCKTDR